MVRQFVKFIIYNTVYYIARLFKIQNRKVVIESVKTTINFNNLSFPKREFRIYNIFKKEVAIGKVMPGRFQELPNHYCVSFDLFVKPFYRQRHYAEKLVRLRIKFTHDQDYNYLISFIRPNNKASLNLYMKLGFKIASSNEIPDWCRKEWQSYNNKGMLIVIKQL